MGKSSLTKRAKHQTQTPPRHVTRKVFTKKDYNSDNGMVVATWGPAFWHILHTMSFNYSTNPTSKQKKQYRDYILSLQNILPCKYCRANLTKNLKELPLTMEHMKDRESFSKYIYNLHELVNKMLNKKSNLTFSNVKERYENFRSRCTVHKLALEKEKEKGEKKEKGEGEKGGKKEAGCINEELSSSKTVSTGGC